MEQSVLKQIAKIGWRKTCLSNSFTNRTFDFTEADIPFTFSKEDASFWFKTSSKKKSCSLHLFVILYIPAAFQLLEHAAIFQCAQIIERIGFVIRNEVLLQTD